MTEEGPCVLGCGCSCGLCDEHTHVGLQTTFFGSHTDDCESRKEETQ